MPSDPTATAAHPDLARYITYFFSTLNPVVQAHAGGSDRLTNLKVLAGVYVQAPDGATARHFGRQIPVTGLLRIAKSPVRKTGAAFSTEGVSFVAGQFVEQDVCYLHELGDAVADDEATLRRLLTDVEEGPPWAPAIAGAADRAALFNKRVHEISSVPANSPSNDATTLRGLLQRHFTYDDQGNYFAKWAGAGRTFPTDTSDLYKQAALREVPIVAGEVYCLAVVPARLADRSADELAMREFLVRIERAEAESSPASSDPGAPSPEGSAESLSIEPIYSVARDPRPANQPPFHQFCFFHTMAGQGLAIPDSAAGAIGSGVAGLLSYLPTRALMQRYAETVEDPEYFFDGSAEALKLRLFATVRRGAALQNLPPGVELFDFGEPAPDGEPDVRLALCPPEQAVPLGSHPDIEHLDPVKPLRHTASVARVNLKVPQLTTALVGAGLQGDGNNVFVGVIDTGIDGSHPAFTGRIQAVWDQSRPRRHPPTVPGGNFGEVLTGADIATTSIDTNGHGTHVCGIAAGAPAAPGYTQTGMAPKARLLVVRLRDFGDDNIVAGASWIFQQAQAAGRPCAINMSLGGQSDDHDGTDPMIARLRSLIRTGANFRPGRLLIAAAGNERAFGMHKHVATLTPATRTPDEVAGRVRFRRESHGEATTQFEFFVRPGVTAPLTVQIFGTPIGAAARCNLAVRIELMPGGGALAWTGFRAQQPNSNFVFRRVANTRVGISNGRRPPLGVRQSRPLIRLEPRSAGLPIDSGVWRITIFNDGTAPAEVHGYIPQAESRAVFFRDPTQSFLIGSPANGDGIIAVASSVNRASWTRSDGRLVTNERRIFDNTGQLTGTAPEVFNQISAFSSPGPVRRTNRTLDACAPGGGVMSARSNQMRSQPRPDDMIDALTVVLSGTSMACPAITGIAACLLERKPTLTVPEFQAWLRAASTMPPGGSADDFGPGLIDASRPPLLVP